MAQVKLSESAIEELASFNETERQKVFAALSLLEQDKYRNQKKKDFKHTENGYEIWGLFEDEVNLAFHDLPDGIVFVDWLSLRSKFR
jgi:hypothetical protein